MEGWVDLCGWLHTKTVKTRPQTVTHPSITGLDVEQLFVDQDQRAVAKPGHHPVEVAR